MAFRRMVSSQAELCNNLVRERLLSHPELIEAFRQTDRKFFTPSRTPYVDQPSEIGGAATISAPHMHALSLQLLADRIFTTKKSPKSFCDVGSGSGYVTGLLANLIHKWRNTEDTNTQQMGLSSHVVGVEVHPGLTKQSIENIYNCNKALKKENESDNPIFQIVNRDGFKGEIIPNAPFDMIHVGVGVEQIPLGLISQLKPGGKCIIPVRNRYSLEQELILYTRKEDSVEELEPFVAKSMDILGTKDHEVVNSFTKKHFDQDTLLECRFIVAQTEHSVPAHLPAYKPNHD